MMWFFSKVRYALIVSLLVHVIAVFALPRELQNDDNAVEGAKGQLAVVLGDIQELTAAQSENPDNKAEEIRPTTDQQKIEPVQEVATATLAQVTEVRQTKVQETTRYLEAQDANPVQSIEAVAVAEQSTIAVALAVASDTPKPIEPETVTQAELVELVKEVPKPKKIAKRKPKKKVAPKKRKKPKKVKKKRRKKAAKKASKAGKALKGKARKGKSLRNAVKGANSSRLGKKGGRQGGRSGKGVGVGNAKKSGYRGLINSLIQRRKRYPARALRRRLKGTVTVQFRILPSGQVTNIRVIRSSGHSILDNDAKKTIRRISPAPSPKLYRGPTTRLMTVPIRYSF